MNATPQSPSKAIPAAVAAKKMGQAKVGEMQMYRSFSNLGQAVFERFGGNSGPNELTKSIVRCRSQIATLDRDISFLQGRYSGHFLTPKRLALGVAALVPLFIFGLLFRSANESVQPKNKVGNLSTRTDNEGSPLGETSSGYLDGQLRPSHVLAFSTDGSLLLSGDGNLIRLWDGHSLKEIRQLNGHTGEVFDAAFSPDSHRIISTGVDTTVRVWDVPSGRQLRCLEGHLKQGTKVKWLPDSRRALSAGWDSFVCMWDVESGELIRRFDDRFNGSTTAVAVSPDGHRALFDLSLIDLETGKILRESGYAHDVSFLPDGHRAIAATSDAHSAALIDIETGQEIRRFEGHWGHVTHVGVLKGGQMIFTSSTLLSKGLSPDSTIRLWDVQSGEELHGFRAGIGGVWNVAVSPDGRLIVSNGDSAHIDITPIPDAAKFKKIGPWGGNLSNHRRYLEGRNLGSSWVRQIESESNPALKRELATGFRNIFRGMELDRNKMLSFGGSNSPDVQGYLALCEGVQAEISGKLPSE